MKTCLKSPVKGRVLNLFGSFLLLGLFAVLACGTQQGMRGKSPDDFEELQSLVDSGEFEIENQWVLPLNGSMIDLVGNSNFIRFKGDSIDLFLPYFGVRHSGGDYGGREGGIQYKGPLKGLEITQEVEKERITVEFEADQGTENYNFRIILFSNGNTNTNVNSTERNSISYRGTVRSLPIEKK